MNTKFKLNDILYLKNKAQWSIGRVTYIRIDSNGVFYTLQCDTGRNSSLHEHHENLLAFLGEADKLENSFEEKPKV